MRISGLSTLLALVTATFATSNGDPADAGAQAVRLYVVSTTVPRDVPPHVVPKAVAEATAIWRRAGVTLVFVTRAEARSTQPDLFVYFVEAAPTAARERHADALAWILFTGERPSNRLFVSPATARRLLAGDARLGSYFTALPPTGQGTVLSRVIGRAIAHEIGHYVFASTRHAPYGLMRATHSIITLATGDQGSFRIDTTWTARLSAPRVANDCSLASWSADTSQ